MNTKEASRAERFLCTDEEDLTFDGSPVGATACDYWRWAFSNVMDNTLRGALAEFIVARALGLTCRNRNDWAAWDLTTETDLKLEIKSPSYWQWWHQEKASRIQFSVSPARRWNPDTNKLEGEVKRHSHAYVFCLLAESDREKVKPLKLEQWVFFVVQTKLINQHFPKAKSLSLQMIKWKNLCAEEATYRTLKIAVERIRRHD